MGKGVREGQTRGGGRRPDSAELYTWDLHDLTTQCTPTNNKKVIVIQKQITERTEGVHVTGRQYVL